jgi:hypothetical protein
MLDIAQWKNSFNDPDRIHLEKKHIRNAWGYIPAVEYLSME